MHVRHAARRKGLLSLASLFTILSFLILLTLVVNVSRLTTRKQEVQNTADGVGYSAGLEMARALNTLTAANHLIGELLALSVLHHAFGGPELEEGRSTHFDGGLQARLWSTYGEAVGWCGFAVSGPVGFWEVQAPTSASGAAILEARKRLKLLMSYAYVVHATGGMLANEWFLPEFQALGRQLAHAAHEVEQNILFEWRVLQGLEDLARELLPIQQLCDRTLVPGLHGLTQRVMQEAPLVMERAARQVAERHRMSGSLFPNLHGLPGRRLELPVESEQNVPGLGGPRSQLVRATTPWVQHWREPLLDFGNHVLHLSQFSQFYHDFSNRATLQLAERQRRENGVALYVLRDLGAAGGQKGQEPWTRKAGSARADELFAVLGFAHRPAVSVWTFPLFRQTQPDGLLGFAQALAYNGNPQRGSGRPLWQPRVGWDTLNWDGDVPEWEYGLNPHHAVSQPHIRLNWQAKLVPTTRLAQAPGSQMPAVNHILARTVADRPIANTH